MIEILDLVVQKEGRVILQGVTLTIMQGEIHAMMGPNGAGKSTLAKVLAGDPTYEVLRGSVQFYGEDLLEKEPEERAHLGLFLGFQYPVEIPGISNELFLHTALNEKRAFQGKIPLSMEEFRALLIKHMKQMEMQEEFAARNINEGFSGGEKKRNEILQMAILDPSFCLLDETDSGLDIDAMKVVAAGVRSFMNQDKALLLITHYQRLLDYIRPDFVHVLVDGKIVQSGDASLALSLEKFGYEALCKA